MPCVVEVRMYVTVHSMAVTVTLCSPPSLRQADRLLGQLLSFSANPAYSKVPSANRNGMPVFFMPPNQKTPVSSSRCTLMCTYIHSHTIGCLLISKKLIDLDEQIHSRINQTTDWCLIEWFCYVFARRSTRWMLIVCLAEKSYKKDRSCSGCFLCIRSLLRLCCATLHVCVCIGVVCGSV